MRNYSVLFIFVLFLLSCRQNTSDTTVTSTDDGAAIQTHSQMDVQDDVSNPDVVKVAAGSKDHTTLVAAVKQAELVNSLSNAGPFTVFAPTNAAFDKLPKGTVDDLMKPEKKDALSDILSHHVYVGVINADQLTDGRTLNMVDGKNISVTIQDGKPVINGKAHILASIPASNGVIHVIDEVLVPEAQ